MYSLSSSTLLLYYYCCCSFTLPFSLTMNETWYLLLFHFHQILSIFFFWNFRCIVNLFHSWMFFMKFGHENNFYQIFQKNSSGSKSKRSSKSLTHLLLAHNLQHFSYTNSLGKERSSSKIRKITINSPLLPVNIIQPLTHPRLRHYSQKHISGLRLKIWETW